MNVPCEGKTVRECKLTALRDTFTLTFTDGSVLEVIVSTDEKLVVELQVMRTQWHSETCCQTS